LEPTDVNWQFDSFVIRNYYLKLQAVPLYSMFLELFKKVIQFYSWKTALKMAPELFYQKK
jgi:hypothetical protein